jgi:hypothetical protein
MLCKTYYSYPIYACSCWLCHDYERPKGVKGGVLFMLILIEISSVSIIELSQYGSE